MTKKRLKKLRVFLKEKLKEKGFENSPMGDFAGDIQRDKTFGEYDTWDQLKKYLISKNVDRDVLEAAQKCYRLWRKDYPERCDGLGPKEIARIKTSLRMVWSQSYSRRLVIERCTDIGGFPRCEKCKATCPKVHVDHINPVGTFSEGFIERLFIPSKDLQGLCKRCHQDKTNLERKRNKLTQKKKGDWY